MPVINFTLDCSTRIVLGIHSVIPGKTVFVATPGFIVIDEEFFSGPDVATGDKVPSLILEFLAL